MTVIEGWENFYVIVGSSAGALIGLQFVVITLIAAGPITPWFRFHYPNHYFYDILVGLDIITQLGFSGDRRLRPALDVLCEKRQRDGTWMLDRVHPDIGPGTKIRPDLKKIRPLVIEPPGKPSKWITLKALTVLKKTGEEQ